MKNITAIISKLLLLTMMMITAPSLWCAGEFVVVIDAGHGGKDHGAVANGLSEKDINLGVAKKLASYLQKNVKGVKVIMTRSRDEFISLQQRADIANKAHADLFISIHTNSVDESNPNREKVVGASTHVLGSGKDEKNLEVARRENSVIKYEKNYKEKYENFDPDSDESYIIFEMVQKKSVQQSIDLAELIQTDLYKYAGRRNRGVHQNGFWVLWATSMPSVLVELDFICNPNSAKFLGSSKGQADLAKGIGEAVKTYVERSRKSAQAHTEQAEPAPATPIAGDYAILTTGTPSDDRVVGAAPKQEKAVAPAKRRRRSEASRARSEKRVVETDEIQVTSSIPGPEPTAQVQTTTVAQQPAKATPYQQEEKVKTTEKTKQPKNNKAKKVEPAPTDTKQSGQQNAGTRQVAERKDKDKGAQPEKSAKKGTNASAAKPVPARVQTRTAGTKTINVKKPRLNP